MIRPPSTRSALAAVLLLSAAPLALAAGAGGGMHPSHAQRLGPPPRADVKPFERAKLSLTQAIADAGREMRGKTLDARFEIWHGRPTYLVRTYSASQVWEGRIGANTGQPVGQPRTVPQHALGPGFHRTVAALGNAQTTLEQAIGKAEQHRGGKAIMARVKAAGSGTAAYDVYLVNHGRLRTAMVNASTGQMR